MFRSIGFNTLWNIDASHMKWPTEWAVLVLLFQHVCCLVLQGRSYTPISCPTQSLHWRRGPPVKSSFHGNTWLYEWIFGELWSVASQHPPLALQDDSDSIKPTICNTLAYSKLFWVSNCKTNSRCFLSFWEVSKNVSLLEAKACCAF